ncbi:MAG: diadenylate cyclase CdaA [Anaerolineaceae bacterium]|nr:diadenylate cyclase CdaA [Anaerolineaceae bacterium]
MFLDFIREIVFIFERLTWASFIDIFLVTMIFFAILMLMRNTQAMSLLRGLIVLVIVLLLITRLINLPAFSWLVLTAMPTMLLAIPVVFAPEIRRGLERLGRAGTGRFALRKSATYEAEMERIIQSIISAISRLSERQHGALMVFQRHDALNDYVKTGVLMNAELTPELMLQIFYPNTPLHDGAVILEGKEILAAACVLPLSASGVLNSSPDRQMGLRHRASLGVSEASDALVLVVSEETGAISIAQQGKLEHDISYDRLLRELQAYYNPQMISRSFKDILRELFSFEDKESDEELED